MVDVMRVAACNLKGKFCCKSAAGAADRHTRHNHKPQDRQAHIEHDPAEKSSSHRRREKIHHTGEVRCNPITKSGALILISVVPAGTTN